MEHTDKKIIEVEIHDQLEHIIISQNKQIDDGNFCQATDAGARSIEVIFFDKINETYSEPVRIKRSRLAKYYSNYQVRGAVHGVTVVEV